MKCVKHIVVSTVIALISSSLGAIGEGPQRINSALKPEFKGVSEREGFFVGSVREGKITTDLTEISFGGITSLSDILTEKDDSHNTLSLSEISELQVTDPIYQSPRHTKKPDEVFFIKALVTIHKKNGMPSTTGFLFPVNIIISGKERDTDVKKAWRLRDISSLTIKKAEPLSIKKELEKMDKIDKKEAAQHIQKPDTTPAPLVNEPLWKIILKPFIWLLNLIKGFLSGFTSFLK